MLDEILSQVNKPGRYIGGEWNSPKKDFASAEIKFALCFPDLYEVGMSNLGMRIIYGILNNISGVCCERFFSLGEDLENRLRSNQAEIFSLESKSNLGDFDIVGFSLGHELNYTNVLNILDLGRIPLKSSLRGQSYPLIIGGGPCTLNPEPLHDFFDLFIIGEAEEAIAELIDLYRGLKKQFKASRLDKYDMLVMFSAIEGVYAPALYEVKYDSHGRTIEFAPKLKGLPSRIKKRIIKDLDAAYFPVEWLVPFIQLVHDRVTLEVMRGCPNRCRFCQAKQQYYPFRQKSVNNIFNTAQEAYKRSGYEELALGGLSVTDYPAIEELLKTLVDFFRAKCVSVSLPSIKPRNIVGPVSTLVASVKKTGLTFAPEAATEKLRNILGKDFDLEDFFRGLKQAFACGYQRVKLYFMIGLPYEDDKDLDAIVDFSARVCELRREVARYPAQVNLSVNALIPKPHTPFQWLKMQGLESLKYKQDYLKTRLIKNRKIKINFHNCHMSFLEGILSRGDRRLSGVILNAFTAGCRFDAWEDHFSFQGWLDAFKKAGIDPGFYLEEKSRDELLPWDFLDLGVNKESLLTEFNALTKLLP